jgi:hypothetical protein
MDTPRYLNYRRVLDLLQVVDPQLVCAQDRVCLIDLAEELLLSRGADEAELWRATGRVADVLAGLVETGAVCEALASELRTAAFASGPERHADEALRLERVARPI